LHDLQGYYLSALHPDVANALVGNVRGLAAACLGAGVPLFASRPLVARAPAERGLMLEFAGAGMGCEEPSVVAPELGVPGEELRVVTKRSYSAFFATDLAVSLARLGRRDLIVCGLYASVGCLATSLDAFARDLRVFFAADAVADFSRQAHDAALSLVANTCGRTVGVEELRRALVGGRAR
jgi:bifunctional isochorismate lyase/aryl carrier protein